MESRTSRACSHLPAHTFHRKMNATHDKFSEGSDKFRHLLHKAEEDIAFDMPIELEISL